MVHSLGSLAACVNNCVKDLSAPTKMLVGLAFLTGIAALNSFDPSRQKLIFADFEKALCNSPFNNTNWVYVEGFLLTKIAAEEQEQLCLEMKTLAGSDPAPEKRYDMLELISRIIGFANGVQGRFANFAQRVPFEDEETLIAFRERWKSYCASLTSLVETFRNFNGYMLFRVETLTRTAR